MVQIKEYTQREGLQPASRGSLNIQKPKAFAEGVGTTLSKKPLDTMSEFAELGLKMKERRDDAMVSEFINRHSIESTNQVNELQQKYKGLNAHKILDKYNEWNEEYMSKYSSYANASDDDDDHVYLENAEQIRKAKDIMARSHVSTLNSLSNYVGREEETARNNALTASIQGEVEKISLADIPENIELSKQNIIANLSALYKGQSGEFINQKAKSMMNAAISGNLMYRAAEDPAEAIKLFNNPVFKDNMDIKTRKAARDSLLKMFIEHQGTELGKQNAGQENNYAPDSIYQTEFFEGVNVDSVKKQVVEKSNKVSTELLATADAENKMFRSRVQAQFYAAQDAQYRAKLAMERASNADEMAAAQSMLDDANSKMADVTTSAMAVQGGAELMSLLNESENEAETFLIMSEEIKDMIGERNEITGESLNWTDEKMEQWNEFNNRRLEHIGAFNALIEKINDGEYTSVDEIPDFRNYGPEQKREIIKALGDRDLYEATIAKAKAKSPTDFDGKIDSLYSDRYGKKTDNPIWYNLFKKNMAKQIVSYLSYNPNAIPDSKSWQQWADNAGALETPTGKEKTIESIVYGAKIDKSNKFRDRYANVEAIKKSVKSRFIGSGWNPFDNISDELAQEVAEKIVDNQGAEAIELLREAGFIGD